MRIEAKSSLVGAIGAAALIGLVACSVVRPAQGDGVRTIPLRPVREVRINGGALEIRQGAQSSLTVRAGESAKRYVVAKQDGDVVELGVPDDSNIRSYMLPPVPPDARIEFVLTTPSLQTIRMGDGEVRVNGFVTDRLLLDANLGRAVVAGIDVDEWRCEMVGGVADVTVSGVAGSTSHTNSSGSRYDDSGLKLK